MPLRFSSKVFTQRKWNNFSHSFSVHVATHWSHWGCVTSFHRPPQWPATPQVCQFYAFTPSHKKYNSKQTQKPKQSEKLASHFAYAWVRSSCHSSRPDLTLPVGSVAIREFSRNGTETANWKEMIEFFHCTKIQVWKKSKFYSFWGSKVKYNCTKFVKLNMIYFQ